MRPFLHIAAVVLLLQLGAPGFTQEEPSKSQEPPNAGETDSGTGSPGIGPTLELSISRRSLKNFLTDDIALEPYLDQNETPHDFESIFVVGSIQARHALFWDPVACRLLGALDLKAGKGENPADESGGTPSPYTLVATGPPPLSVTAGASGMPEYFGFRMVDGTPEFLYTFGSLVVEERIWLENRGEVLKQRFSFRDPIESISILFPDSWKERVEASVGTWKENVLLVPKEDAGEILLTYRLTQPKQEDTN